MRLMFPSALTKSSRRCSRASSQHRGSTSPSSYSCVSSSEEATAALTISETSSSSFLAFSCFKWYAAVLVFSAPICFLFSFLSLCPSLYLYCTRSAQVIVQVWVWVVSSPVIFVNGEDSNPDLNALDYVGWALWLIGFILQMEADLSKMSFKNDPDNKGTRSATCYSLFFLSISFTAILFFVCHTPLGKFCDKSVWAYSRHPNYAGEILMWWGIFMSAANTFGDHGEEWGYVTCIYVMCLAFVFVSDSFCT